MILNLGMKKTKTMNRKLKTLEVSELVIDEMKPFCHRIEVSGDLRRGIMDADDVDIVLIPKAYETGLFASGIAQATDKWRKISGELPCDTFSRVHPSTGVRVNFHIAEPATWGFVMTVKTGPQSFNESRIFYRMNSLNISSDKGWIVRGSTKNPVAVPEEEDFFRVLGVPFIKPEDRR